MTSDAVRRLQQQRVRDVGGSYDARRRVYVVPGAGEFERLEDAFTAAVALRAAGIAMAGAGVPGNSGLFRRRSIEAPAPKAKPRP